MHICTCQCLLLSNPTRSFFATLTEQRMTVLHGLGGSRGLGGDMAVWHGGNRCGEWWGGRKPWRTPWMAWLLGPWGVWVWKFREGRCLILIEQSGSDINGQAKINFLLASLKEVCFVFQKLEVEDHLDS